MSEGVHAILDWTLGLMILIGLIVVIVYEYRNRKLANEVKRLVTECNNHQQLSLVDPLTEVANRRAINFYLEYDLERLARYDGGYSFMFVDLDRFKAVNDSLGHQMGDEILLAVATSLYRAFRTSDKVGRYGGDEFVVLMPSTARDEAKGKASEVLAEVRRVAEIYDVDVTASIGVVTIERHHFSDLKLLIKTADECLYLSKNKGGDFRGEIYGLGL